MNLTKISLLLFLFSCDFTSGLHKSILRAQDYIKEQEYLKAVDEYEDILKGKPSDNLKIKIHFQLGEIYSIYLNQTKKALDNFQKVIELADVPSWQVKSLEKVAEINFEFTQDFQASAKAYKTLIDFIPKLEKQDFYSFRYAQAIQNMRKYEDSIKLFEEMKNKTTHEFHVKSYYEIGLSYFYMKNWKQAIAYWKDYIVREKNKNDIVMTKFLMANAYETNEELKKAYNIYYSILNDFPNPDVIKNRLESLYARRVARKR